MKYDDIMLQNVTCVYSICTSQNCPIILIVIKLFNDACLANPELGNSACQIFRALALLFLFPILRSALYIIYTLD